VAARTAEAGLFLMEVFPALALPALSVRFDGRHGAPKCNPRNRRQFRREDWHEVTHAVASHGLYCCFPDLEVMDWAKAQADIERPVKADQDRLDAVICALIGMIWRTEVHTASAMIGDLTHGYMVTPVSLDSRKRLSAAAAKCGVPFAGPAPSRGTVEDESEFDHHLMARGYEEDRKATASPASARPK
jgi:predicted RNase H-like nuclease